MLGLTVNTLSHGGRTLENPTEKAYEMPEEKKVDLGGATLEG